MVFYFLDRDALVLLRFVVIAVEPFLLGYPRHDKSDLCVHAVWKCSIKPAVQIIKAADRFFAWFIVREIFGQRFGVLLIECSVLNRTS